MANQTNVKRMAKNTMALYFRMIFLLVVSFYTVRVILQVLGAEDYGLYNVVAGFVSMFGVITDVLINAAQRYFAFNLAMHNWGKLNKMFSLVLGTIMLFVVVLFIMSETFGLWFVFKCLVIPSTRLYASVIVYEISLFSLFITLLASPLTALLVADENLSIYAIISVGEGILKLLIVYALLVVNEDKLILYAMLLLGVTILVQGSYCLYCKKKYKKLSFRLYTKLSDYREVFAFINWNLFGTGSLMLRGQGVNIVMNLFFGPVVNAARGIANQSSNVVVSFASNFMRAVNPQITKAYATGNREYFLQLIDTGSKLSFYLLFVVALPFMMNVHYVLSLWLVNPPEYSELFIVLVLIDALLSNTTQPLCTALQSIGKLKEYQLVVGGAFFLNLPLAYIALLIVPNPWIPFIVTIMISIIGGYLRMWSLKHVYPFSLIDYVKNVCGPTLLVGSLSAIISYMFFSSAESLLQLIVYVFATITVSIVIIYIGGLNRREQKTILTLLPIQKFTSRIRLNHLD